MGTLANSEDPDEMPHVIIHVIFIKVFTANFNLFKMAVHINSSQF